MEKCGSLGELLCLGEQMKGGHSAKISPLEGELRDRSSMEDECAPCTLLLHLSLARCSDTSRLSAEEYCC